MKILVMGTGAIGGCYGGMLARVGCDVTFIARGANLDAIRSGGLRVESVAAGSFTVHCIRYGRPILRRRGGPHTLLRQELP